MAREVIDRRHIDAVVRDEGRWVGLCDGEGWPVVELPPVVSLTAPESRLVSASVEVTVHVQRGSAVEELLVAEGLGTVDAEGRLVPATDETLFLVVVVPGEKLVYTVTHAVGVGVAGPDMLTIHGVDLVEGLSMWPCPSIPLNWSQAEFQEWTTDASGEVYKTPRMLAQLQFGQAADGYTVKGRARDTIRTLVQDSLDSVNAAMGWGSDPHMVVDFGGGADSSDEVLIRTNDDSVFDTISAPALNAGVNVQVDLWWPGDEPVRVRTVRDPAAFESRSFDKPMQVVRVEVS